MTDLVSIWQHRGWWMAVKSLKREMKKRASGRADPSTCYKGQGFGECRWPSLGEFLLHILIDLVANATILYYRTPPHLKCSQRKPVVRRSGRLSVVAPPIPPKPASTDRWGSVQQLCIEILFKQCSNIVKIFLELRWLMKIVLHSYGRALGLWLADWHWGRRWIRMIRSDENDGW